MTASMRSVRLLRCAPSPETILLQHEMAAPCAAATGNTPREPNKLTDKELAEQQERFANLQEEVKADNEATQGHVHPCQHLRKKPEQDKKG